MYKTEITHVPGLLVHDNEAVEFGRKVFRVDCLL